MEFIESYMKFFFPDDDIFRIEKDKAAKDSQGTKVCECVVHVSENIVLIEAKSSAPRIENKEKFNVFISDICQKFSDSLQLFFEIKDKKKGEEAYMRLPENLRTAQVSTDKYGVYFIIHGHQLSWLSGIMDAFKLEMTDVVKKWKLRDSNIKVFNEMTALENGLIVAYIPPSDLAEVKLPDGRPDEAKVQKWFVEHS